MSKYRFNPENPAASQRGIHFNKELNLGVYEAMNLRRHLNVSHLVRESVYYYLTEKLDIKISPDALHD